MLVEVVSTKGSGGAAGATDESLRLEIPPETRYGRVVRERIAAFALAHHVSPRDATALVTAVAEAVANAVEHAGTSRAIEIACTLSGERLTATVVDHGMGFDASALRDPRLPEPLAVRGRGLPIMRQCSDLFAIRSAPGEGTAVTVGRYVRRGGADDRMLAS